ncbi:MAG: hypothetical protein VZR56_04840 [Treponema sp.]|nr:hypothetical protein [Treponema sp.]
MSGWKSYLLMALVAVFIIWLLMKYIIWKTKQEAALKKSRLIKKTADAKGLLITCPLCGSYLQKGEDLFSRVYRPMNVPHQLCTISGCPHCYPALEPGLKRECPVCHKQVPMEEGHLVARLFNYADGKKHVVVTGCTECCKKTDS